MNPIFLLLPRTAAEPTDDQGSDDEQGDATTNTMPAPLATGTDNLIGDLLSLDLNSGAGYASAPIGMYTLNGTGCCCQRWKVEARIVP